MHDLTRYILEIPRPSRQGNTYLYLRDDIYSEQASGHTDDHRLTEVLRRWAHELLK